MENEIRRQLPGTLQRLVDEVETAGGVEIEVRRDPNQQTTAEARTLYGDHGQAGATPDSLSLILSFKGDIAATDKIYRQPFAVVAHELLHLRRWVVQQVPGIHSITGLPTSSAPVQGDAVARLFTTTGLDELVEHSVIDPSLPDYGLDFPNRGSIPEIWDAFPNQPWEKWGMMRWIVLQEFLRVHFLVRNSQLQRYAEDVMRRFGMLDEGRWLVEQFRWLLASPDQVAAKFGACFCLCVVFHIPPTEFMFLERRPGYLGIRNFPPVISVPKPGGGQFTFHLEPPKSGCSR